MMEDCQAGIGWVLRNIEGFGGDPKRVFIMGQSCGGHLAALTLQNQYEVWDTEKIKASNRRSRCASAWNPDSIKVRT
jgi:acetyl esterase/lipase